MCDHVRLYGGGSERYFIGARLFGNRFRTGRKGKEWEGGHKGGKRETRCFGDHSDATCRTRRGFAIPEGRSYGEIFIPSHIGGRSD